LKVRFKNSLPLLLLWLFLSPTGIQLHHHHDEQADFRPDESDSIHARHEACAVCKFHFPLFSAQSQTVFNAPIAIIFEKLVINYSTPFFSIFLKVASVRGPPQPLLV
jgi:hypothetical protein